MQQFEQVRDLLSDSNIKNTGLPKSDQMFLKNLAGFIAGFLKNLYFDYDENTTERYVNAIATGCAMCPDDIVYLPRILTNIVAREKLSGDYLKYQEIVDLTKEYIVLVKSGRMHDLDVLVGDDQSSDDADAILA